MASLKDEFASIMLENIASNDANREDVDERDFEKSKFAEPSAFLDDPEDENEAERLADDEEMEITERKKGGLPPSRFRRRR